MSTDVVSEALAALGFPDAPPKPEPIPQTRREARERPLSVVVGDPEPAPAAPAKGPGRIPVFLHWLALLSVLALSSHAEWRAGAAANLDWRLALAMPGAIDAYVMSALLRGRDVWPALLILEAAIVTGGLESATDARSAITAVAVGTLLTVVLWRVDVLFRHSPV